MDLYRRRGGGDPLRTSVLIPTGTGRRYMPSAEQQKSRNKLGAKNGFCAELRESIELVPIRSRAKTGPLIDIKEEEIKLEGSQGQ